MTPQQITLIRHSFQLVAPFAQQTAELFYKNLFEADADLRRLFKGDLHEQGAKLMQMIGAAIKLLDQPQTLLHVLRQLGARHGGYGVQAGHYASVGGALLLTLEQGLGAAFDAPTRAAWTAMYEIVSRTMIDAAEMKAA